MKRLFRYLLITYYWSVGMSGTLSLKVIPRNAKGKEKEYDWLEAAESYKKALGLLSEQDFLGMSEIYERLGYALYRFAFQAESGDEFDRSIKTKKRKLTNQQPQKSTCRIYTPNVAST